MKTRRHLPLIKPDVRFDDVAEDFLSILESGQLTSGGFVTAFERAVADYVGVEHGIAVTSATTALHLALVVSGIGPGDDVLISDFTFPATANVVLQQGARPVLVDSLADGFEIDPEDVERRCTDATRAIIAVDPFGQPADHMALERFAAARDLTLIADAACSLGASRDGRRAGAHGDVGCFSFHPRKTITCGEGGMLTTNDGELARRARSLRSHGAELTASGIVFTEPGFNYRLSELQAALGMSQMRRIDEILADRRRTCQLYQNLLSPDCDTVLIPRRPVGAVWSYQSFVVVLADEVDRTLVIETMGALGIETTIGTYACHQHPAFQSGVGAPLPNSARFARQALTLPVLPQMPESEVTRVVEALRKTVGS
ncbi:MAG: DegT/DnrJ/EryC1/StrS family aminotransferase [Acidimicrobiales bacterium]|nr:DegT/DnrJ/EryC1/StrS family aminotransferase [Acidimicrobiales bacterium]